MPDICDDFDTHVHWATDGRVACQHCYAAAKAENKRLREALREWARQHGDCTDAPCRSCDRLRALGEE
jgi:hypothetical protein